MTFVSSMGAVHVRKLGQGPGPALLLHCALAHGGAWKPVMSHLGDRLDAVAPDMPGHGRSADWDGQGDLHDRVTANAAALLTGPTHVIGHSFGATVALRLALERPEYVRSLVLIEPVLFAAARAADPAAYDAYRDWGAPMARAMAAGDWTEAARRFTASWGTGQGWEDLTEAQRAQYTRQMPLIAATQPALLDDSRILLRPGGLEALQMPVLMLRGAKSMPIMGPIHTALFARIPQSRDVEIPGAGHMVPISHPSAVAAEIGPFLDAA